MTIEGNRITDPTTVASATENTRVAPVSPTGAPMIPPKLVPWMTIAVLLAGVLPFVPGLVLPPLVSGLCAIIVTVGAALGIASPGARKGP